MDVIDIIKDSFIFPSKDMKTLLIYVLLSLIAGAFSLVGILVYILGFIQPECFMWGGMAIVVSMLIGWVMYGYSVSVIKSGIDLSDEVPKFEWWENFIIGFDNFIVTIVYFLIPAFITLIVPVSACTGNALFYPSFFEKRKSTSRLISRSGTMVKVYSVVSLLRVPVKRLVRAWSCLSS